MNAARHGDVRAALRSTGRPIDEVGPFEQAATTAGLGVAQMAPAKGYDVTARPGTMIRTSLSVGSVASALKAVPLPLRDIHENTWTWYLNALASSDDNTAIAVVVDNGDHRLIRVSTSTAATGGKLGDGIVSALRFYAMSIVKQVVTWADPACIQTDNVDA